MPRANRYAPAGRPYHVINRGNDRRQVFHEPADYKVFLRLASEGTCRFEVDLHAHCLMPNHFHLIVEPTASDALSSYMQWVTGNYACYFRSHTKTIGHGHVFQRRFWHAPIHDDHHFLTVLRYVEANPCRANLVARAEEWSWSSLAERQAGSFCTPPCHGLPKDWCALVNEPQSRKILNRLRRELVPKPGRRFDD